jgi:adenylate kinase family enzyme
MRIDEVLNEFDVAEGINDPNIFKAVFLAGGPGAGKGYVAKNIGLDSLELKTINPDEAFEYLLSKNDLEMDPETIGSEKGQELRARAKQIQQAQQNLWKEGRLGLLIDGTAKDVAKISRLKTELDAAGYDSIMLFVNTDLDTNLTRNRQRARTLPDEFVTKMWGGVQKNIGAFQTLFGKSNFMVIDNSLEKQGDDITNQLSRAESFVRSFLKSSPTRPLAKQWIKQMSKGEK